MQRCPRGCRPASPPQASWRPALAGYIDEGPVDTNGSLHVWIAPGGEDFLASPDHAMWALRRLGIKSFPHAPYPESAAFWELMKQGWVRLYARYGAVNFQMSGAPSEAQTRAMQRYLDLPGMVFRFADVGGRVLDSDPVRRMTAGRIAAWARQALEPAAAVGGLGAPPANVSFSVKDWQDYTTVKALQTDPEFGQDDFVGVAEFWHRPDGATLVAEQVSVLEAFQRQGIASHMYQLAEEHTGKTIIPSDRQTPNGQSFWTSR